MADQNFVVKNTLIANGVFTANSLLTQANNLNVSLATNTATLNTTGLANIAALNVVGAVNTATLYTTGLVNAASLNVVGAVNTATFNSTGLVNAASLNVVGLTNTASINVVGAVNTATLNTTGLANTANLNVVGAVNTATLNTTGLVSAASLNVAGAVNTATFNSTGLVNAASLNVTGIANVQSGNFYANNLILQGDGTNAYIRPTNSGSVLTLGSNNTNQITLAANGNLGIGTATPANKLDVNGDMHVSSVFATYLNGSITSSQVTTALGYTPYNSTNPSGYISAISGSGNVAYDSSRLGGTAAASYALLASPTFTGTVTTGNVITVGTAAYHVSNGNFGVGTSSPLSKIAVQPSANNTDALTVGSSNYTNYFTIKTESSANAATLGYWCGSSAFGNVNISANYVNLPTNVTINGLQAATQSYVTSALSSYAPIAAPSFTGIVQDTTNYAASPSGYDAAENLVFNNSTNITGLSFSGSDNRFFTMGIGPANSVFMRTGSSAYLELNVGKVGIGTGSTLPSYKLDVVGDIRASANVYSVSMNANGAVINGTNGYFSAAGGVGQLQAVGGSGTNWYNAFLRNDGNIAYLLQSAIQTSQGAATNASWNSYRPFQWNLSTGAVTIDNGGSGTTFGGVLTAPSITLNSTGPGISFPNGVELYEDGSGNGPGDLVIETNNGTGHYTIFYSNGSFSVPSTIYQGSSAVATQSYVTGYAPSQTGSGASGTWGINVTGSAASITGTYGGSITSSQITTGLGYTPYNSTNPSGYITSSSLSSYAPLSGATFTGGLIFPNNIGAINIKSSTGSSYNAFQVDSANNLWLGSTNYNGGIEFYNNGACNAIIDTGGNLTVKSNITAYSDMRLKDNILTITNALDIVDELRGVTYNRIDTDSKGMGVIAQEVEAVIPEVVMTGEDGYKSVAYGNMVGLLIEAVKELRSEIEILKSKVL